MNSVWDYCILREGYSNTFFVRDCCKRRVREIWVLYEPFASLVLYSIIAQFGGFIMDSSNIFRDAQGGLDVRSDRWTFGAFSRKIVCPYCFWVFSLSFYKKKKIQSKHRAVFAGNNTSLSLLLVQWALIIYIGLLLFFHEIIHVRGAYIDLTCMFK